MIRGTVASIPPHRTFCQLTAMIICEQVYSAVRCISGSIPHLMLCLHMLGVAAAVVPYPENLFHDNTTYEPEENVTTPATAKQIRWAEAAYSYIVHLDCKEVFFTSERECKKLVEMPRSDINIYIADPTPYGQFAAVLPDGGLSRTGLHDAVITVDPYPLANFGHLVLVFYVEIGVEHLWCQTEGGIYLDGGECMLLALKRRCKNALQKRQKRRNFARRCEINYIPNVYMEHDEERSQMLTCRSNIPGFAPCPTLRSINESTELICNPIRDNTKRCQTSHDVVKTHCKPYAICDQAVLISGGWNRWTSRLYHQDNINEMYHMLRNHGFHRHNIEVFYANGAHGIPPSSGNDSLTTTPALVEEDHNHIHPAAFKIAMRYHIQRLCGSPHCVDSFLIYMNSPARNDGASLLWDTDGNGEASEHEVYTQEELLSDLENCEARQVNVIVDQSYSGEIARAFRRSKTHKNVMVFTSSKDNEYSYQSDYTKFWSETNHTAVCMKEIHRDAKRQMQNSTPESVAGEDAANVNIFGAPCDVLPPFTHKELRQNYLGCQNLPTALWVMAFYPKPPIPKLGDPVILPHSPENSERLLTRHRESRQR